MASGAFLGSIVGVSAIAAPLGLASRSQAFAALFCATLPNAILQASGAKNDMPLACWMVCAVYFAARRDVPFTALSVGLALATKATAYLFLPPILAAVVVGRIRLPHGRGSVVKGRYINEGIGATTVREWLLRRYPTSALARRSNARM